MLSPDETKSRPLQTVETNLPREDNLRPAT